MTTKTTKILPSRGVPAELKPIALISQGDLTAALGATLLLDGRASYDPQGADLTYNWEFSQIPIGSSVVEQGFRTMEDGGESVSFTPDVIGMYRVQLTVYNGSQYSDPAECVIVSVVSAVPHGEGLTPNAEFLWGYLSNFWSQFVSNRDVVTATWSSQMQMIASELLRAYEVDYQKSITDIQQVQQRAWLNYDAALDLGSYEVTFVFGDSYSGADGYTGSYSAEGYGFPLTQTEFVVTSGVVGPGVSRFDLNIAGGQNKGSYRITKVTSRNDGYVIERNLDNMFSAPYHYREGTGAITVADDDRFYMPAGVPSGVAVGDYLEVVSASAAGLYPVKEVAGGYLRTDRKFKTAGTGYAWRLYRPDRFSLSQRVVVSSCDNLTVPPGHDLAQMNLYGGRAGGRLLIVNDKAHPIDQTWTTEEESVVTVRGNTLPYGVYGVRWRVPRLTIRLLDADLDGLGVSPGDLLELEVVRQDSHASATILSTVVGCSGDRVGVEITLGRLEDGDSPWLSDQQIRKAAEDLTLLGVVESRDGGLSYDSDAGEVHDRLTSMEFRASYFHTILNSDSDIDLGAMVVRVRPKRLVRNRRVPINERVVSIPLLSEYIVPPTVQRLPDGSMVLLGKDGGTKTLERIPVALLENQDFVIDRTGHFDGEDLEVREGETKVLSRSGAFVERSVLPGDQLVVTILGVEHEHEITEVVSNGELRVKPAPEHSGRWLTYRVVRQDGGKFIRFVPGIFSPVAPAPDTLWAEVTYIDNRDSIEANYGYMVDFKIADYEVGSTSNTYKASVAALMYAYAAGSSMDNIRIGVQTFLGLPIAERDGIILDIKDDYKIDPETGLAKQGRILVEDIDQNGNGVGVIRPYYYVPTAAYPFGDVGVDDNPDTDAPYVVGDFVSQFAPLCKGVGIEDYLTDPDWWNIFSGDEKELLKYHRYIVNLNADLIDFDDIPYVYEFLRYSMRPVWKLPIINVRKFLLDEIEVRDSLDMHVTVKMYDDLGWISNEAAWMHGYRGRYGLVQVAAGSNPFSNRGMQWLRDNCRIVPNPDTGELDCLYYSYGGFIDIGDPPGSTAWYYDPPLVRARSEEWNREGDIVYIAGGQYNGRYEILHVFEDGKTLQLGEMSNPRPPIGHGLPFPTEAVVGLVALERRDVNPLCYGTAVSDGTNVVTIFAQGAWNSNVTPGDLFIVQEGEHRRAYRIYAVGPDRPRNQELDVEEGWPVNLTLDRSIPAADLPFRVIRQAWQGKTIIPTSTVTLDIINNRVIFSDPLVWLREIVPGDEVVIFYGLHEIRFRVIDAVDPYEVYFDVATISKSTFDLLAQMSPDYSFPGYGGLIGWGYTNDDEGVADYDYTGVFGYHIAGMAGFEGHEWVESDDGLLGTEMGSTLVCDPSEWIWYWPGILYGEDPYQYEYAGYDYQFGYYYSGLSAKIERPWVSGETGYVVDKVLDFIPFDSMEIIISTNLTMEGLIDGPIGSPVGGVFGGYFSSAPFSFQYLGGSRRLQFTGSSNLILDVQRVTVDHPGNEHDGEIAYLFRPGDRVRIEGTSDSEVDFGYGPGIIPIVRVDSEGINLSRPLTAAGTNDCSVSFVKWSTR